MFSHSATRPRAHASGACLWWGLTRAPGSIAPLAVLWTGASSCLFEVLLQGVLGGAAPLAPALTAG